MGHYIEESNQLCQDKSLIYSSLFWAYDRPELKTKDLLSKTTQNSLQGAEVGLGLTIPGPSDSQFEINSSRRGIVRIRVINYAKSEIVIQLHRVIHYRQGIAVTRSIFE